MPKAITFLHTSPVHVARFERLLAESDPQIPARHLVHEKVLEEIRRAGFTPSVRARIAAAVREAADVNTAVVVCTCSTIGGCAEEVELDRPLVRVDRAMAEHAVAIGSAILVVAALGTTLVPTKALMLDVAKTAGKTIRITEVLCESAWPKFEAGDQTGYLQTIAECVRTHAAQADVVVLAQASMADAAGLCSDLPVPILSSPRLGVAAALQVYRAVTQR